MIIEKEGIFITDVYGSAPAMGSGNIVKHWAENDPGKMLTTYAEQKTKKSENALEVMTQILSIFHRDSKGRPFIGPWMLRRCLMMTYGNLFNAMKDKSHPKKTAVDMAIGQITPVDAIYMYNGKPIKKPEGVKAYTVSLKDRSFFKAYEVINAGTKFKAKMEFNEDIMSKDNVQHLLNNCGNTGVGAFRERFGKFKWVK